MKVIATAQIIAASASFLFVPDPKRPSLADFLLVPASFVAEAEFLQSKRPERTPDYL
ncbi:MAG TPA: hypothetical protein VFS73_01215 [Solirubrobacterales bacterium]|jgi:hypothetical protein|nr:hypothetical protein [Solirubrobacterales bacterium]